MFREIVVYEAYKPFFDKIASGEIPEFYLTTQMPSGITVSHGKPANKTPTGLVAKIMGKQAQEKKLERKLREQEVVCVAATQR